MNKAFTQRAVLFSIVAIVLTIITLTYIYTGVTYTPWPMYPPFADLITITGSVDCLRNGMDPYSVTSFDPWLRTYNYPRLWLSLFDIIGFDRSSTNILGISMAFLFSLATCLFFSFRKPIQIITALALILSPSVLFLLERGNSDTIIYLLIVFAVFYLDRINILNGEIRLHLKYLIIIFTACLKIYPGVLLALIFFEDITLKKRLIILSYAGTILAAYIAITYSDISMISKNTPRPSYMAYGKNAVLQEYLSPTTLAIAANLMMLVIAGLSFVISKKFRTDINLMSANNTTDKGLMKLFVTGALLYWGSFFIGNNWDYRLVFTLLMLPLFLQFNNNKFTRILNTGFVMALFCLLYGSLISDYFKYFILLKLAASWAILIYSAVITFHIITNTDETKRSNAGVQ